LLVPESKSKSLEMLAGEREVVYELQANAWRDRRGHGSGVARASRSGGGDEESGMARVQRVSGSVRSNETGEKKWWRGGHAV
jgi:PHS family inorganic phosphate transporter-like MFS transporter